MPHCFTHFWWFKGVIRWEVNGEEEHSTLIWTVTLFK